MRQVGRNVGFSMMLVVGLLLAGCGQELKKENEQLKTQVASLQKENAGLKTEMMALKGDNEAMKKQLDEMKQHMEQMQQQMKGGRSGKPARKK
jgi:outer membrane murein-binding lipoprotein Lpp